MIRWKVLSCTAGVSLLLLILVGCSAPPAAGGPPEESLPASETEVPAPVLKAQEAVLGFLQEGAYGISPPPGVTWTVDTGASDLPEGFVYYFFASGSSIMSITYPEAAGPDTLYHVSIGDTATGLCWQANVDSTGSIVETGTVSELSLGDANPAALFCESQGYRYEIHDQPAGGQCGVCVFPDESTCISWAYLRGQCGPGDRPANG